MKDSRKTKLKLLILAAEEAKDAKNDRNFLWCLSRVQEYASELIMDLVNESISSKPSNTTTG